MSKEKEKKHFSGTFSLYKFQSEICMKCKRSQGPVDIPPSQFTYKIFGSIRKDLKKNQLI